MVLHLLCFTVAKSDVDILPWFEKDSAAKLCGFFSATRVPGVLFALYLIWTTD
jgi:hypothetical protein